MLAGWAIFFMLGGSFHRRNSCGQSSFTNPDHSFCYPSHFTNFHSSPDSLSAEEVCERGQIPGYSHNIQSPPKVFLNFIHESLLHHSVS